MTSSGNRSGYLSPASGLIVRAAARHVMTKDNRFTARAILDHLYLFNVEDLVNNQISIVEECLLLHVPQAVRTSQGKYIWDDSLRMSKSPQNGVDGYDTNCLRRKRRKNYWLEWRKEIRKLLSEQGKPVHVDDLRKMLCELDAPEELIGKDGRLIHLLADDRYIEREEKGVFKVIANFQVDK